MKKTILLWILAFLITAVSAVYQRVTGPTHAMKGSVTLAGENIDYRLERAHEGNSDQIVAIPIGNTDISGQLYYKRHNVNEEFTAVEMQRVDNSLQATLPWQPPAGKLEYYIELRRGDESRIIPGKTTLVTRFKGLTPKIYLIPHIILMFAAMLVSTQAGLQALTKSGKLKGLTVATVILMGLGGMILGPVIQYFAFGDAWTGIPFGWDLTDNKTLIAFIVWLFALVRVYKHPRPRWAVLIAAVITLVIFIIPHSVMGSELDYTTGKVTTG